MRVLVLAFETPLPSFGGSRLRILHLARRLAEVADVEVDALGEVPTVHDEPFELRGTPYPVSRVRALLTSVRRPYLATRFDSDELGRRAGDGEWDVVQTTSAWLVDHARRAGVPVVLDAHNVEEHIVRSLAEADARPIHRLRWRWEAWKTRRAEAVALASVDVVLACSEIDAAALSAAGAARVVVVPNGVDTERIAYRPPARGSLVLYVGQLGYRPNEAAALHLLDEVLPRIRREVPEAAMRIVGREPSEVLRRRAGAGVEILGDVPDVVPHLHEARVMVVPLLAGSGTRLKILEAMAAGLPVVTTAVGASGLDLEPGCHVLLGETPDELAAAAQRVIRDDALARSLSEAGRRLVVERYDWSIVTQPMVDVYRELRAQARSRG